MVFPASSPWERRGLGYIHFISLPRARRPQLHLRGQGGGGVEIKEREACLTF